MRKSMIWSGVMKVGPHEMHVEAVPHDEPDSQSVPAFS